ncbi:hypothetical protein BD410DRAFT_786728 [Rickenella mellea]|uniref:Phosphatidate phosphatase APP1 catalytic domain-containing protein n=1 Tax=Rickenella mellea TaxID=50990 RepID=A0A4Y7Q8U0_9AGAM|nr:hypothetical protein BD410DRAFT_786728 [Rickenella mellea]
MPAWKALASARVSSFKEHVGQLDYKQMLEGRRELKPGDPRYHEGGPSKQSWSQWAGEKIRRKPTMGPPSIESIALFPGWATRRFHQEQSKTPESEGISQFSLDIFVSGYATTSSPPEYATRSQKAFMRVARAFAALPNLPNATQELIHDDDRPHLSKSTEDLLAQVSLPPRPEEINEESEIQALERQFHRADEDRDSISSFESDPPTPESGLPSSTLSVNPHDSTALAEVKRLHDNFTARLQPFWSRALPNRLIRLSVYTSPKHGSAVPDVIHDDRRDPAAEPVTTQDVLTSAQGDFQAKLNIPWERICQHPGALHIAFGSPDEEREFFILAELLPPPPTQLPDDFESGPSTPEFDVKATLAVPITQSHVRLISDIDDTIKFSNILGGARAVFRNVFVRSLEELVVQGMGEWYMNMWSRGVRFHYVSNGPFELLPVVNEFIKVSNLPQGSIKLKSYSGRSLFNGLLSAPATRKRDGVIEILDNFSSSRFFLVGDTGEQDLELFSAIAAERHLQILGVFVRDASGADVLPLDDPTGQRIKQTDMSKFFLPSSGGSTRPSPSPLSIPMTASPTPTQEDHSATPKSAVQRQQTVPPLPPRVTRTSSSANQDYFTAAPSPAPTQTGPYSPRIPIRSPSEPIPGKKFPGYFDKPSTSTSFTSRDSMHSIPSPRTPGEIQAMPPAERKRYELQMRVYKARMAMPSHIPLRIFREPLECVEAARVLDELQQNQNSR